MKNFYTQFLLALSAFVLTINSLAQSTGWTTIVSPTTSNLYGVAYSNADTIAAVGDGGTIIRSVNGGKKWTKVSSPVGDPLRAVAFNGDTGLAVGISGRMLRTTNGGASWKLLTRITTKNLYAVSMSNTMSVITGEEGTILVSTDRGLTWAAKGAGTASILFGVSANGTNAVGAGGAGAIVMSTNNGAGWGLTVLGTALTFFYGVSMPAALTGYTVGISGSNTVILRTDNGGFSWSAQPINSFNTLFGVSFTSTDNGYAVGTSGTIFHTTNGGQKWNPEMSGTTQTLDAVAFHDPKKGLIVGDAGTILLAVTDCVAKITPLGSLDICATGSVALQANPGTALTYQWIKNNKNISGATDQMYTATSTGNYKVLVTETNGCSKISKVVSVTSSCISNSAGSQQDNLSVVGSGNTVYPNPSRGEFVISVQANKSSGSATLEIINIAGQKVYSESAFLNGGELKKQIQLPATFHNGVYTLRVICGSNVSSQKIIVER